MSLPRDVQERMAAYPEFLRKVWRACASIPRGEVRSYGWIARRIGRPSAARAVGQALKRNPFSPVVPCHRVVPAGSLEGGRLRPGGPLGGYTAPGGVTIKARLLRREGALKDA